VKWEVICKPKEEEGLGIKDLKIFDLPLLEKWKWPLLNGEKALWKDVLKAKYIEDFDYPSKIFEKSKFNLVTPTLNVSRKFSMCIIFSIGYIKIYNTKTLIDYFIQQYVFVQTTIQYYSSKT